MDPIRKRVEVAQLFEGNVVLLCQRADGDEKVRDQSGKVGIAPQRRFHMHGWRGQPNFLKDAVKSGSHLRVYARAQEGLMDRRKDFGPKWQPRAKGKKRNPGGLLEDEDSARTNQL